MVEKMVYEKQENYVHPVREFEEGQHYTTKAVKIKNKRYRQFLDSNEIDLIGSDEFDTILDYVDDEKNKLQARAFLIVLYVTGGRPNEVLRMRSKDVKKSSNYYILAFERQ